MEERKRTRAGNAPLGGFGIAEHEADRPSPCKPLGNTVPFVDPSCCTGTPKKNWCREIGEVLRLWEFWKHRKGKGEPRFPAAPGWGMHRAGMERSLGDPSNATNGPRPYNVIKRIVRTPPPTSKEEMLFLDFARGRPSGG